MAEASESFISGMNLNIPLKNKTRENSIGLISFAKSRKMIPVQTNQTSKRSKASSSRSFTAAGENVKNKIGTKGLA